MYWHSTQTGATMSMGGDFYALTDNQLTSLLEGALEYGKFLYDDTGERPHECLSRYEHLWYELSQVLADEEACGVEQSDAIPEMCGYTFSRDVTSIARMLERLDEAAIRDRCEQTGVDAPYEQIWSAVQDLSAFYRRAADKGNAILFRVT